MVKSNVGRTQSALCVLWSVAQAGFTSLPAGFTGIPCHAVFNTDSNNHSYNSNNNNTQRHRAALPENNEATAEITTANGGTFTSSSARLSSQSRYRSLDRLSACFNVIGY